MYIVHTSTEKDEGMQREDVNRNECVWSIQLGCTRDSVGLWTRIQHMILGLDSDNLIIGQWHQSPSPVHLLIVSAC